ncbi:non-ribosomal peptide synthetase [Ktedonobacteria bacterium brp13]|nr:non-ribosomal peptide synthetase [Ktedonobacteria bacterium brp13]
MSDISRRVADLAPEKLKLFMQKLSQKKEGIPLTNRRSQISEDSAFPLSFAQQRLWFLDQLEPGSTAYLVPASPRLRGELSSAVLERSLAHLMQRHEVLRTTFHMRDGQPVQVVHPSGVFRLPIVDLRALALKEREHEARRLASQDALLPCDLEHGPLLRTSLLRLDMEDHVLLLTMHHIISDGWSSTIFMRELTSLYRAFSVGQPSPLPVLPVQYIDFALWQRQWLQGEILETQLAYWRRKLADVSPLELPTDHPRLEVQAYRGAHQSLFLPRALSEELNNLCQQEGVTLFMLLLTALSILLARYTGQTDICVGTPIANRTRPELEHVIGFFVNTLVMRSDLAGNPTFLDLLRTVRTTALEAYGNQDIPFEYLVEKLQPERDLNHTPFFQVMFSLEQVADMSETARQPGSVSLGNIGTAQTNAKFDLTVSVVESRHGLGCDVEYAADLFDASTIQRLLGHWQTLLASIVAQPQQHVYHLPLLTGEEWQLLLDEWHSRKEEPPAQGGIHTLIEAQSQDTPDAVAVVFQGEQLSYAALNQRADRLARYLRACGVEPGTFVGVCMERSLALVVALIGVLKCGAAYVPLDPAYPAERLAFMLTDAHVPLLLTQQRVVETLPVNSSIQRCRFVDMDARDWLAYEGQECLPKEIFPEQIAYMIYTSGSTGTPKGVMVAHSQLLHTYNAWEQAYHLRSTGTAYLQMANVAFDVFTGDLIRALCSGAKLVLCPQDTLLDAEDLYALMRREYIDMADMVPAVLRHLLAHLQETSQALTFMRLLIVGSDAWYGKEYFLTRQLCADQTRLVNAYGVTEAAIDSTYFEGDPSRDEQEGFVPIGHPYMNTDIYILDEYLQPVPIAHIGELYIGGPGLAYGYWQRPELTAERFIPHPWSRTSGQRLYKTGDAAHYRADGTIVYRGRLDSQVKLRGYRIELQEIEARLLQHPSVHECAVLQRTSATGETPLVAYVAGVAGGPLPSPEELHCFVREHLPYYMLPTFMIALEALPLTANGKVDRRALLSLDPGNLQTEQASEEAKTPIQEMMAVIWREVLNRSQIGLHDNFFALGGHSLLATRLISRVRTLLQIEIQLRALFEEPTIAGLTHRVEVLLQGEQPATLLPLVPVPRTTHLPLSFAQQRLWLLDQLQPGSPLYLVPSARRLYGSMNVRALETALEELIHRHEILRTTFREMDGQAVQVIAPASRFLLPIVDLGALTEDERESEVQKLALQEAQQPCDLSRGPLLRVFLLDLDTERRVFLLTMHHIITDAWSEEIFYRELIALYHAALVGQPAPLPPLPVQYADFAVWQRQWLQGETLEKQLAYWKRQLADVSPLELPTDHPYPLRQTFHGALQSRSLPVHLSEKLDALSQREGVTLFMLLLAAYQTLLARYSGQTDISVGTAIVNRSRSELERLLGFFMNTLVLCVELAGNPSFLEVLKRVREVALGAYAHQDVPFEYLVEELSPRRNLSRSPLFQLSFTLQHASDEQRMEDGRGTHTENLSWQGLHSEHTITKFELSMLVLQTNAGLHCSVEYNTDLFESSTIARLLEHWQLLLEAIVEAPQMRLSDFSFLSPAERQQTLIEWNATHLEFPDIRALHTLVEAQAERTPDALAVVMNGCCLSYGELNRRANQLASYLLAQGNKPYTPMALYMERSLEGTIALLAVLKAGGIYVPLDPSAPVERLSWLLEETQATILITRQSLYERFPQVATPALCLDLQWQEIFQQPELQKPLPVTAQHLAYIMYTSGSTGRPKGVMIEHAAIVNRLWWGIADVGLQSSDRVMQVASWGFDIALWELFGPWMVGATIVIVPPLEVKNYPALIQRLHEERITLLHAVPSLLNLLVQEPAFAACHTLRCIQCGGEAVSLDLVRRVFAVLSVPVHQFYGPTESSISVTCWTGLPTEALEHISIGRPIANTRVYLVDAHGQPVVRGAHGEIWIGGAGLAWGYLQRPEQTAERFVPDPFSNVPGARVYRTGDVARYLPNGEIEFVGRSDTQVKIRGYRVEPSEIEVLLLEHPEVSECVVLAREDIVSDICLVAYVVGLKSEGLPPFYELRAYLQEKLPDYMVPSYLVALEALPLTPNGKVDRHALPGPEQLRGEERSELVSPRTPLEELLAELWKEVLGRSHIGPYDDFFALGGHSLLAMRLIARVQSLFSVEIAVTSLFEASTLADFALQVEQAMRKEQESDVPPLLPVPRTQDLPLSFAQQRLWFLDRLQPDSSAYLIPHSRRLYGFLNVAVLERTLNALIERHESLRTIFQERVGKPVQIIHQHVCCRLPVVDISELAPTERETEAQRLGIQEAQLPCDLERGPLLRTTLLRLNGQEHIFLQTMHHIITDGWSSGIFQRELTTVYHAFCAGQPSPLQPLPIQYADFAIWQRDWLQGEILRTHLAYWRWQLAGAAQLQLPTDHPYPARHGHRGALHRFSLPRELYDALIALSRQEGATLFMTLLTTFQILFYRYSGQTDIVVGTDFANRNRVETEDIIGFFVNVLALRTNLNGRPSFRELLARVRKIVLDAYAYQETPFDLLVEKLVPDHTMDRMPLVQVLFVLQNLPSFDKRGDDTAHGVVQSLHTGQMEMDASPSVPDELSATKFDLALFMHEQAGCLYAGLTYSLDLFEADTIALMAERFVALLQSAVKQPDASIDSLDFLAARESAQQAVAAREIRRELHIHRGERFDVFDLS